MSTELKFIAIDVETTLNGNEEIGLAHPMHPDNKIVLFGMEAGHPLFFEHPMAFEDCYSFEYNLKLKNHNYDNAGVLCGHNISFDLMYLYKESPDFKAYLQEMSIWDTQLAEYILSGQRIKFSSLDELSIKYGLPVKDDKIKKYFQAGLGSEKIPREELLPYLKQDLSNTLKIAYLQYDLAVEQGQLNLIQSQMWALHATTEMMFNGLHIDTSKFADYTVEVANKFVECKLDLEEMCALLKGVEDINSPKQWSQFFFGGTKKIKVKEEVGTYKNGNTKYKQVDKELVIKPHIKYTPDPDKVSEKTGQVSVDDSVLTNMLDHTHDSKTVKLIKKLLEYRELSKQLSTYVKGLGNHTIGNFIHGKLNHTATVTGRLSSTNPNLQNISNNPIKQIFTSRYEGGLLVEVDFNQLEVVALAHVTKDMRLIADITSGIDIHSALYNAMFGRMPTKEERKPFKGRTFQLIYGAGAKAISKQAGCSLEEAKKFIDVFYTRYPSVATWHNNFLKDVEACSTYLTNKEGLIDKYRTCVWKTETGRRFVFTEYYNDASWSSRTYNFSPTELKNYPIQGLATGDIVPMMLGVIFDKFKNREDVKMVNTIHDSLVFDVKREAIVQFILEVTDTLKDTDKYFYKVFNTPLALKLNAGASFGTNWFNMEEM